MNFTPCEIPPKLFKKRLTFTAAGAQIWSTNQTVTVEASADSDSLDETATLTQSIGSGSATEYSSVSVNDVAVSVTDTTLAGLSIADASVSESGGSLDFTVTLGMASSRTVTVDWTLAAGTATAGTDYDDSTTSGTLTFSSGGSLTQTISVPVNDNSVVEGNKTVTVTLSGASGELVDSAKSDQRLHHRGQRPLFHGELYLGSGVVHRLDSLPLHVYISLESRLLGRCGELQGIKPVVERLRPASFIPGPVAAVTKKIAVYSLTSS